MRKPSILFMNRVYPPFKGGTGRVLRDLARHFAKQGWQVTVITSGAKSGTERDGAVRVLRVKGPEKPKNILGYIWIWIKMIICALRLPASDVLITQTDPPLLAVGGHCIKLIKK